MMNITSKAASIVSDTQRMNSLYKSQAIIEFTPDGIVLDANQNFLDCMGYSLKSIQGKHHSMFMPADQTKTADYRDFWAALARGSFVRGEFHRISQSGNDVWLQASYNPVIDRSGKVRSVLKIASDITDKKQEAVDNAGQIDAINRSQAVIHFDLDGKILEANENFCAATGYQPSEIIGKHHSIFVDKADQGSAYRDFWDNLRAGKFERGEFRRLKKTGEDLYLQASYNPIFNEYGKPFKVIKFASDITAEVMRRTELQTVSAQIDSDLTRILEGVTSAASQIGEIINLISSIAAQTNLLSLNATIEAARAGEAGRGFAVVAGEVKALANQSAKASDDISNQITSVQEATRSAVAAIEIISKVIEEVNDISVSISSAVEEQACVTRDISTNMGDATVAVNNISQGVHGIAEATNLIQTATEKVKSMSSRIAS